MQELKSFLTQLIGISESEWEIVLSLLTEKTVKAKTQLVSQGSYVKHIYLIQTGLLRAYHLLDGKEINTYFATDGQFISTYAGVINKKPSHEILEAIEDSMVYAIAVEDLEKLYQQHPKFEKLGRYLAEQNYLCILNRTILLQTKTATEKYEDFIQSNPLKIVQRVPQHHIASFLGITPESLSRIRKKIVRS